MPSMDFDFVLYVVALSAYGLSTVFFFGQLLSGRSFLGNIGFLLLFVAVGSHTAAAIWALPFQLQSPLLITHLAATICADALLLLAGLMAATYLLQDKLLRSKRFQGAFKRLPPIQVLDTLNLRLLSVGFVLMTVGIVAGSVLAADIWGGDWYLDPRQMLSCLIWLIFAFMLLARLWVGWRGKKAAWLNLLGVALVIIGLLGLEYLPLTLHRHSYSVPHE